MDPKTLPINHRRKKERRQYPVILEICTTELPMLQSLPLAYCMWCGDRPIARLVPQTRRRLCWQHSGSWAGLASARESCSLWAAPSWGRRPACRCLPSAPCRCEGSASAPSAPVCCSVTHKTRKLVIKMAKLYKLLAIVQLIEDRMEFYWVFKRNRKGRIGCQIRKAPFCVIVFGESVQQNKWTPKRYCDIMLCATKKRRNNHKKKNSDKWTHHSAWDDVFLASHGVVVTSIVVDTPVTLKLWIGALRASVTKTKIVSVSMQTMTYWCAAKTIIYR